MTFVMVLRPWRPESACGTVLGGRMTPVIPPPA